MYDWKRLLCNTIFKHTLYSSQIRLINLRLPEGCSYRFASSYYEGRDYAWDWIDPVSYCRTLHDDYIFIQEKHLTSVGARPLPLNKLCSRVDTCWRMYLRKSKSYDMLQSHFPPSYVPWYNSTPDFEQVKSILAVRNIYVTLNCRLGTSILCR